MDDHDIPGLMDYIQHPSVVDSPANRKAYRIAYAMAREFSNDMGVPMVLMPIWSEKLERLIMWAGLMLPGGFVPVSMIHQTELQGVLDLRCSPHCEGDGSGCALFKDVDPSPEAPQVNKPGTKEVNESFAHIVQGWDSPLPNITELSKLYDIPTEGEGDAQGSP